MLTELSLFTGAGGGVLASILLGHRIVGYVENNEYCQKIIAQRIKDGIFDEAPIFGDIRDFNSQGYAESYKGLVDVVSGGFPCQDISCSGKGAGITGERSGLWFEMETAIRIIRPRFVFIENSPMLLVRGFEHIIYALSEMGYSARWGIISAADVGAPHLRKRLWVCAYSNSTRFKNYKRIQSGKLLEKLQKRTSGKLIPYFPYKLRKPKNGNYAYRKINGCSNAMDRVMSLGNAQVPLVAATAWKILSGE